jgi:hypothetical protein
MTLNDQIIDEAEMLARDRILGPYPTRAEIANAVSEIVGVKLGHNTTGAYLAEAAHNRVYFAQEQLAEVAGSWKTPPKPQIRYSPKVT